MENLQKIMLCNQNGIVGAQPIIAAMEDGLPKVAALAALAEFKKADEHMRKRLFILQVWRKHGPDIADECSRRKAGEFLDPDLVKALERKDKINMKRELELEKEKERLRQTAKRAKNSQYYDADFGAGSSSYGGSQGRGGHNPRGRGGLSRGGAKPTSKERRCYLCQAVDHIVRDCPKAQK